MDIIKEEFDSQAVEPGLLKLYNEETAIKLILRCKELGYKIIGIESILIKGTSEQPFMEHSVSYLFSKYGSKRIGCWDESIDFIKSKHQYAFVFDVSYLIPDDPVHGSFPDIMSMSKGEIEYWIFCHFMSNVNFIEEYSDTVEAGKVISYIINVCPIVDKIKLNTPIEIVISKGKIPHS